MVEHAAIATVNGAALPLRDLLRGMRRVRAFEERVGELFARAALPRHSHLYIGEEAVAVGACCAVRPQDYATSTHRGHGHLIAKGADFERAFAEIAGKATGYCKGKGGTMHVADLSLGFLGAISIVGGGIPIAVGGGLSAQIRGTDQVTLCFFGDGAANNGNFGEGLNVAGIWRLPVIFICENNQYNEYTPTSRVTAGPSIASRAAGYGMPGLVVDGNDAVAMYEAVRDAAARARAGEGPTLLECVTYRARGHSTGDPARYRDPAEVEAWLAKDPIARLEQRILESGAGDCRGVGRGKSGDRARSGPRPGGGTAKPLSSAPSAHGGHLRSRDHRALVGCL